MKKNTMIMLKDWSFANMPHTTWGAEALSPYLNHFAKVEFLYIKNGAVLTGSSINIKLLIILITKAHDWVLKLTFANIVFLFVKSIRHLFFNTNLTYQPNSFCTSKQGQALAANSLWPWTVARGNSSCSCSTSARSEAFCAAVRVSLGLPSVDRPPI